MGLFPPGAAAGGHAVNPGHIRGRRAPTCRRLSQVPRQYHHLGQFSHLRLCLWPFKRAWGMSPGFQLPPQKSADVHRYSVFLTSQLRSSPLLWHVAKQRNGRVHWCNNSFTNGLTLGSTGDAFCFHWECWLNYIKIKNFLTDWSSLQLLFLKSLITIHHRSWELRAPVLWLLPETSLFRTGTDCIFSTIVYVGQSKTLTAHMFSNYSLFNNAL